MIEIHGRGAAAKSAEFVDELNSVGSYTLARAWEPIRNEIRVCRRQLASLAFSNADLKLEFLDQFGYLS